MLKQEEMGILEVKTEDGPTVYAVGVRIDNIFSIEHDVPERDRDKALTLKANQAYSQVYRKIFDNIENRLLDLERECIVLGARCSPGSPEEKRWGRTRDELKKIGELCRPRRLSEDEVKDLIRKERAAHPKFLQSQGTPSEDRPASGQEPT